MVKKFILILFLLIPSTCFSAELLVRATGHWMDKLTQEEVDKMLDGERESYNARSQKGDIIVVRPDGWTWGKEECLPNYIVVKVPDIKEADAKKFEEPLTETVSETVDGKSVEKQKILRVRKHNILVGQITSAVDAKSSVVTFTKSGIEAVTNVKSGLTSEVLAPSKDKIAYIKRKAEPYIAIAYNFYAKNAYAATQLKKTVMPSGGDYTSLEACMNGNEQNLVTADKYFDVEIDGTWSSADTTAVVIHNYTTDATRYINIYTTSTARHKGVYSTSYYVLYASGNVHQLSLLQTNLFITIDGIQIVNGSTGDVYSCIKEESNDSNSKITIKNNIIKGLTGTYIQGIRIIPTSNYSIKYIYNNIIYGFSGSNAIGLNFTRGHGYIYNNTIYGCTSGFVVVSGGANSNVRAKNNLCNGNTTDFSGTFNAVSTNNLSEDATAPALNTYYINKSVIFNNEASYDFHLGSSDTYAINLGVDLHADGSIAFNIDIDKESRPDGNWDIGADEYVSAGTLDDTQIFIL